MSGFIANGTAPAAEADLATDEFWPTIDIKALRAAVRVAGEVPADRLRAAVVGAVIAVNDELHEWSQQHTAAGITTLAEVQAPSIDGKSRLVQLYLRAVYSATAVEVHERYRSYDATAQGSQRADDLAPIIDELRRDQRYAISDILGTRRVTVELI